MAGEQLYVEFAQLNTRQEMISFKPMFDFIIFLNKSIIKKKLSRCLALPTQDMAAGGQR